MSSHIKTRAATGTWVVRADGAIIAESAKAVELIEGTLPAVIYFPQDDVAMEFLERSDSTTYCPHKGTASYYSIQSSSGLMADAVWSYAEPFDAASGLAGHLAFYPDKVVVEQV